MLFFVKTNRKKEWLGQDQARGPKNQTIVIKLISFNKYNLNGVYTKH